MADGSIQSHSQCGCWCIAAAVTSKCRPGEPPSLSATDSPYASCPHYPVAGLEFSFAAVGETILVDHGRDDCCCRLHVADYALARLGRTLHRWASLRFERIRFCIASRSQSDRWAYPLHWFVIHAAPFRHKSKRYASGLGVGGIAVAHAAQKALENVIAGVSLIVDHAVRVRDFLNFGDLQGTVVEVGLRSTRIRTGDRTPVSFLNGQIANMRLETLSARDMFLLHPVIGLRYRTDPGPVTLSHG